MPGGEHPDTHPFVFVSTLALPKIVHEQTMRVREAKESDAKVIPQMLIILDDCLGEMARNEALNNIVTRGRHAAISVIAISQTVKGLGLQQRRNFSAWVLCKMSDADFRVILEEFAGVYASRKPVSYTHLRAHET